MVSPVSRNMLYQGSIFRCQVCFVSDDRGALALDDQGIFASQVLLFLLAMATLPPTTEVALHDDQGEMTKVPFIR